jgi:hypothetical protein
MASMEARERLALISESLAEVLNPELIESVLAEGRNPRVYWGSFHDVLFVVVGNYANSRVYLYQERPRRDALTADTSSQL